MDLLDDPVSVTRHIYDDGKAGCQAVMFRFLVDAVRRVIFMLQEP